MRQRSSTQYLSLVLYKTYAELRAESARTYVGFLWWILEPIVHMVIYYVVFALLLRTKTEHYVPFLLIGLVSWRWFSVSLIMGAGSIHSNIALMRQAYLPKALFPIVTTLKNSAKFAFSFAVLLIFLWAYGFEPQLSQGLLLVVVLMQFLLTLACALVLAAIVPLLPDLLLVIENALRLLFFLSGVFFTGDRIPAQFQTYFYLNPMARLIRMYRELLMSAGPTSTDEVERFLIQLWPVFAVSVALLLIGTTLLHRLDRTYPKLVA